MTIATILSKVVNDFVSINGTGTIMSVNQLYDMVAGVYFIKRISFLPSDYCYNRTNEGLVFDSHVHLFEWIEAGKYRLLGQGYPYSGTVYCRRRGDSVDTVYGHWNNGIFHND